MASTFELSGDAADLGLVDFFVSATGNARKIKGYVRSNLGPADALIDTTTGLTLLGDTPVTIASDGTWSVTLIDTAATDLNITAGTLQYELVVSYTPTGSQEGKRVYRSGWFALTADTEFSDPTFVATQLDLPSVTPGWRSDFVAEMEAVLAEAEAARDGAVAITGPVDAVVEGLVKNTGGVGPLTSAALSATFGRVNFAAPPNTLAFIGTSITNQNSNVEATGDTTIYGTATRAVWGPRGYWHWAKTLLGQRLEAIAELGVGGNTSTQMLARFNADVLGLNPLPGWLLIEPGPNDQVGGITAATTIANVTTMVERAQRNGIRVILGTVTPSSYMNTAQRLERDKVNRWMKRTAPALFPQIVVVDWAAPLCDPATGAPNPALFWDEGAGMYVHPIANGAAVMGAALARALENHVPPLDTLPSDAGDQLNALAGANPFGTGGTSTTLPTGWTAAKLDGSAIAAGALATVPSYDDVAAFWGQVTIATGDAGIYVQETDSGVVNAWKGRTVYAECEFETDETWENIQAIYLQLSFYTGTGEALSLSISPSSQGPFNYHLYKGVLRTPAFVVPANAAYLQCVLNVRSSGGYGAAGTAQTTFRMRRPQIREVGY